MQRFSILRLSILCIFFAAAAAAQGQQMTFGGGADGRDERQSTWVMYFDSGSGRSTGGFALNYNRVLWKEDYAKQLETILRGKTWRLGKHFWTTLDSNLPLEMAGVEVKPGYYYLGLQRSEDGSRWNLALIDSQAARQARLDAFNISEAKVVYAIPLSFSRAEEKAEHLSVFFEVPGSEQGVAQGIETEVVLHIAFGPYQMTAPLKATH